MANVQEEGQKKRWLDNVIEDCEALRLPLPDADSLAHDRVRWRTMIYNRESGAARALIRQRPNVATALSQVKSNCKLLNY